MSHDAHSTQNAYIHIYRCIYIYMCMVAWICILLDHLDPLLTPWCWILRELMGISKISTSPQTTPRRSEYDFTPPNLELFILATGKPRLHLLMALHPQWETKATCATIACPVAFLVASGYMAGCTSDLLVLREARGVWGNERRPSGYPLVGLVVWIRMILGFTPKPRAPSQGGS